ncbi:MAG: glutaredoxin 3 [Chitinophagales bacterium]|jgi:glutaredoxin 3
MSAVIMYTTPYCPYCMRAKDLFNSKGIAYEDIDVAAKPELRSEMMERSGQRTVPQIWINEQHVGGFTDLYALDVQGKLDGVLARQVD